MDDILNLPFEKERYQALLKLASDRHGDISEAEKDVLRNSAATKDLQPSTAKKRPEVRASFLRWLATDKDAANHIDPLGIRVAHATISDLLDLDSCKIPFPLEFHESTFNSQLTLRHTELPHLYLLACTTEASASADGLITAGNVFLRRLDSSGEISLIDAQIGGDLDCEGATLKATGNALTADGANIAGDVFLFGGFSSAGDIRLVGATIAGDLDCGGAILTATGNSLHADRAKITGGVFLDRGFSSAGEIRLLGAQIGGDLVCESATLKAAGDALSADGARITGDVVLDHGFFSAGIVRLPGAQIGGNLECDGATLKANGTAMLADGALITGNVFLHNGFSATGEVELRGARIGGDLVCTDATFTQSENSLDVDQARISGSVFLRGRFSAAGTIIINNAEIGGQLSCVGAKLTATGTALSADSTKISRDVFLSGGFSSTGEISLLGATIGGALECGGATLTKTGSALLADRAKITGSVFLNNGFSSTGEIRLLGATIGGSLECDGAVLTASGVAFDAEKAQIDGQVFLRNGFSSTGAVSFVSANAVTLDCTASSINHLDCKLMRLTGDLYWAGIKPLPANPTQPGSKAAIGELDLTGASVATLNDDHDSWPPPGRLHLQDLVYQDLALYNPDDAKILADPKVSADKFGQGWYPRTLKLTARDRIEWLNRQPDLEIANAQPWMQLAKILKDAGDEDGAKEVVYEYNRLLAKPAYVLKRAATWPVDLLQKQPFWVAAPIALLTGLGSLVFWRARRMRAMVPTDKDARTEFEKNQPLPGGVPPFNPFVYALENVLPVIKLGQDSAWAPDAEHRPGTWLPQHPAWLQDFACRWRFTRWLCRLTYTRLAILRWTLIIFGWVLAGILTYAIGQRFEH